MSLKLKGFKASRRGKSLIGDVVIKFKSRKNGKTYSLSQRAFIQKQPSHVWKLPSGDYILKKVSFIDNNGVQRTWKKSKKFVVRGLNLSNFGTWTISPKGRRKLKIKFKVKKSRYKNTYQHESFMTVINGLTGKVQKVLGGGNVLKESSNDFGSMDEMRTSFTRTVNISMFYLLDLGRNNHYAKTIVRALQSQDLTFRNCYTSYLQRNSGEGKVSFRFTISRSNGLMSNVRHSGGSLRDGRLVKCLQYRLGLMQFSVSRQLQGKITFQFKNS